MPELQRTSLAPAVLQLKALGVDDVIHFDFPCPPPARHLAVALELLYALKGKNRKKRYELFHPTCGFLAIDDSGRLSNPLGLKIAELPVDPITARMLLMSGEFGVGLFKGYLIIPSSIDFCNGSAPKKLL